ncbi:MAG: radical SAM protein, partial [Paramuribaculum sp.]|nr:radical SAM protein [Paramuribaculum sp.]
MIQDAINPFASVLYVMPKPVGSACNLACSYCYYLEKDKTLECSNPQKQLMSDNTLEEFIKQYIAAQTVQEIVFTWHGGEAMMRPIKFYEHAMELQRKYGKGRQIVNCIQTNGTLLNARWCEFLKRNNWLVGISIDGPSDAHDAFRRTAFGKPTHQTVMRSIRMLQQYGVEWNAMAVVNSINVHEPERFYDFFKQIGCRFLQFTPVVERRPNSGNGFLCSPDDAAGQLTKESVTAEQWGEFAVRVFDRWVREDVGKVFVQLFDATLAGWVGVTPGVCSLAPSCGHAAMME